MIWPLFTACVWLFFFSIEKLKPFRSAHGFLKHDGVNLAFGVLGSIILAGISFFVGSPLIEIFSGLLKVLELHFFVETILAFLLLDLWMYAWHRINHRVPFLWYFHRIHHSDLFLNASSAFRFHFIEVIISFFVRIPVLALIGLNLTQLLIYEFVFRILVTFHHSNILLPIKVDEALRSMIVSPHMHRVHHSELKTETDSNYASVFSFWDRLFKSYSHPRDMSTISYGLDFGRKNTSQDLIKLIKAQVD